MINKTKNKKTIPWYSRVIPNALGVSFTVSTPILAGGRPGDLDVSGRSIDLSCEPISSVFFNLAENKKTLSEHKQARFDYILGDSDAAIGAEDKMPNGTMIYWHPINASTVHGELFHDDPIIVPLNKTYLGRSSDSINDDWLCLRRVGNASGEIFDEEKKNVWVRSKVSHSENKEELVDISSVAGRVFANYTIRDSSHVSVGGRLPFSKRIKYPSLENS